jgi:hypothetical protein
MFLAAGAASLLLSRPAAATGKFAMGSGAICADCHLDSNQGGALTAFGKIFEADGGPFTQ